jgi:multidrug efflux pump subunit AcrB
MFISDFAIKRPIITVTAMVALVAFGCASLLNLHTDEFPDIQAPIIGLTIAYPGASPAEVGSMATSRRASQSTGSRSARSYSISKSRSSRRRRMCATRSRRSAKICRPR